MPESGTSGSDGGPGWATTQVYPTRGQDREPQQLCGAISLCGISSQEECSSRPRLVGHYEAH